MPQYFNVKVQFVNEDNKKQSVNYLVDAMSVTEAEAKTIQYLTDEGEQSFEVKAASESKIVGVISTSDNEVTSKHNLETE
jgi:Fe-S cluster assembly iron-binding protein IscA